MEYRSIINHPENGEMLNLTDSAKYLGISRRKFRRIAPSPDYLQDRIYPFWSRRVLDILPLSEEFNQQEILKRGKACGCYLIGTMDEGEIRKLRNAVNGAARGGRIRNHTCGIEDETQGLSLPKKAAWGMRHCDCRGTTPEEEIRHILQEYGVKITFRSGREAEEFRNGILSAIKDYVARKISNMEHKDAHDYIWSFCGGGSYESLLARLHGTTIVNQAKDGDTCYAVRPPFCWQRFIRRNWLCYDAAGNLVGRVAKVGYDAGGDLVGRVVKVDDQWYAALEGEMPFVSVGDFASKAAAKAAVERAVIAIAAGEQQ